MKHVLVVGGTGMLAGVSLWLLDNGYHVSILARNAGRMKSLIERTGLKSCVTPILVDYHNEYELRKKVKATIKQNGDIDMVVAWIHSTAERALELIVKEVSANENKWELFHILGSSSDADKIKRKRPLADSYFYHQVQLGFIDEGSHSRWLTNEEISKGVIEAVKKKEKLLTIGQIEPWERRP